MSEAEEIEGLKASVLFTEEHRGRALVLEYAAVLERLREKLPGWVSREMIRDHAGKQANFWPAAVAMFTIVRDAPAKAVPSGSENAASPAAPKKQKEKLFAAVWRIAGGTCNKPFVFLSAGKSDKHGFQPRELSDQTKQRLVDEIKVKWNKQDVTVVSEFSLMDHTRLENGLGKRLESALDSSRTRYRQGDERTLFLAAAAPYHPAQERPVPDPDAAHVAALRALLEQSMKHISSSATSDGDGSAGAPTLGKFLSGAQPAQIFKRRVDFYDGYALYRMVSGTEEAYAVAPRWELLKCAAAAPAREEQGPSAIVLNGSALPIHALNAKLARRMRITEDTATDYLRFFCQFVHGRRGAFLVLNPGDDLAWRKFANDDDGRKQIVARCIVDPAARWMPAKAGEQAAGEVFYRIATVNHGQDLFLAFFEIGRNGIVAMPEDTLLIRDLPVEPFRFTAGTGSAFACRSVSQSDGG